MQIYFRAMPSSDPARQVDGLPLCGGPLFFDRVECLHRGGTSEIVPLGEVPSDILEHMTTPRTPVSGLDMSAPLIMGILNVTPDSFSDGGLLQSPQAAVERALQMVAHGADLIDIGGESTRPGAAVVSVSDEIARVVPVIQALRYGELAVPISVDTRKSAVAREALDMGATILNDVSALTYCPDYAKVVAASGTPVCLMHAQGDPETMQESPQYDDVLLDVYDYLDQRIGAALEAGIARHQIVLDPGIGFGKTKEHNMALLRRIGLFHSLGCPLLLGVSRKRFIGTITGQDDAAKRGPGSAAMGLLALNQGVQILRVHDVEAHQQMRAIWQASNSRS